MDLAVYVKNPKKLDYLKLFGKISRILLTEEMDLVIVNDTPLSLAGRILQNRRVLIDKAPFLRQRYESLILRKYFDQRTRDLREEIRDGLTNNSLEGRLLKSMII